MYRVVPVKGEPFTCNGDHVLVLHQSDKRWKNERSLPVNRFGWIEITVDQYMKSSAYFQQTSKLVRTGVAFPEADQPVDPYFLGVWLGDGTSTQPVVTTPDSEVVDFLQRYCDEAGLRLSRSSYPERCPSYRLCGLDSRPNTLLQQMRAIGLLRDAKFIPRPYLIASRQQRLRLLAGLVDTDGYVHHGFIEITQKSSDIAQAIVFLARSLGFGVTHRIVSKACQTGAAGLYSRINIFGSDLDQIPCLVARKQCAPRKQIKNAMHDGIQEIIPLGDGDYYGFELEGDGLFLLGDFTVTHNTRLMQEFIKECLIHDKRVALYTNRILLTSQTSGVLEAGEVNHGVRAAGFSPDLLQHVQICSIMTEHARCVRKQSWSLHPADVVLVDEAHAMKGVVANHIFNQHVANGATLIGVTATPLGVGHIYQQLVVAGVNSQLRACGAHVPCITYGPDEPDLKGVRRTQVGEFVQGDVIKAINRHVLYGRVEKWWRRLNPDERPTILFAPGVSESKWFVDQFMQHGITAAHIDGKHIYVNGEEYQSTQERRDDILRMSKTGEIKILCNRFVLREGIDAPWLYHCIMATPFGSLTSYLQAGGRLLRSFPGLPHVILQDHGGNFWRHGSLNEDRVWNLTDDEYKYAASRSAQRKEAGEKEPICCTHCGYIRSSGAMCPQCGEKCTFHFKNVIQLDGTMKRMTSVQYHKVRQKRQLSADQRTWYKCYFTILNVARRDPFGRRKTMREVGSYFQRMTGKWPSSELQGVPQGEAQWRMHIEDYQKKIGGYRK
jgi:superfamily II DNA or RNA helicase